MGESSQPNPESDVISRKVSVSVSKNLVLKKVSVSVSNNLVSKKGLSLGLKKFGLEEKSQYWSRNHLVSKKSLGIGLKKSLGIGLK